MKWSKKRHELDFIGEKFSGKKRVFIYGVTDIAFELISKLSFLDCIAGFIDGNEQKQKDGFMGYTVSPMQRLREEEQDFILIIAARPAAEAAITKTLLFEGYKANEDFYYARIFMDFYLQIYAMYGHDKMVIQLLPPSITEKCTLKCVHCNHSLAYIENPVHFDKEAVKRDMDLFYEKVDFVYLNDFVGGELFTHPDLYEILEYTASRYRDKCYKFQIVTNGTIVPSDEILELMKKYNMNFHFTNYSHNVPHIKERVNQFIEKVTASGVQLLTNQAGMWRDYAIGKAEIVFEKEEDKIRHFDYCSTPCRYIKDGRLYFCTTDRMAQRAGLMPEDDKSYIDLNTITKENHMELLEFEYGFNDRGYPLTCTKCNGSITVNQIEVPMGIQWVPKK